MTTTIRAAILATGCLTLLSGQSPAAPGSPDKPTLYILFLSAHAEDAARRAADNPGTPTADLAAHLHVKPSDLPAVDYVAALFAAQDKSLREEALKLHQAAQAAGNTVDVGTVRSFTTRRSSLATAAMESLRSRLSPESYAGLQQYLGAQFQSALMGSTR